jgi:hypothetical protein
MRDHNKIKQSAIICGLAMVCLSSAACNGGSGSTVSPPPMLNISLSSSMALAPQDGTPAQVTASITGNSGAVTISVNGVPNGTSLKLVQPSGNTAGMITLTSSPATPAGSYMLSVSATAGASSSNQNLTLVVAVAAVVASTVDTNLGVNGKLQEFMSTSFQPAEWDYQFFLNHTATEPAQLNTLGPQHIRIQGVSQAVPMKSNTGTANDWDFTMLDAIVQPILSVTDHSPEFQIAVAPAWMQNASGQLDIANHLTDFVNYSANLVRYYNTGGFTVGTTHFQSASPNKITWWGIFNEYNINGLTAAQYVQLYDAMVPAMLAVDPTIKFSALELADFDSGLGDPRNNLPTFFMPAAAGGVSTHVDILSTHFYSSCNQKDTDTQLFNTVPGFVNDVSYFYQEVKLRPDLGNVPVWVTENNVNADFDKGGGISACNGTPFVTDQRGTSAFFAAWRPYVFSQLGKVGNQALYHWDYDADAQYGEADYGTGNKYLSYWMDYWLGQLYAQTPAAPDILTLTATETATTEILATKNSDGSVLVMVVDRAVLSPSDNNGTGDLRTAVIDISALGNFTTASQLNIGAGSNVTNGPQPASITPASKLTVNLPGYGVTFLILKP